MLRTSVSQNVRRPNNKMNYGQYKVDQIVADFEESVQVDGFTNIVYTFLKLSWLLVNPKLVNYQTLFNTFLVQHYHEFLFHYKQRNNKCEAFIKAMKDFDEHKKPKKKDYQALFETLSGFKDVLGTLPGGHVNGIPFVFSNRTIDKWFYDEVVELRKILGFDKRKEICMVCGRGHATESLFYPEHTVEEQTWSGHTHCAANCIKKCAECPLGKNNKMLMKFGVYLIQVGYETRSSLKEKWSLDIPEKDWEKYKNISNYCTLRWPCDINWTIFQEDAEEIHPILAEIEAVRSSVSETVVRQFHLGQNQQEMNEICREQIVCAYDSSVQKIHKELTTNKRKYEQLQDTVSEQEMTLVLQRRKTNDAYEENEYLKTRLDTLKYRSEQDYDRLKDHCHKMQYDLQQSIRREWQYYNQLNKRPRFI